MALIVFGAPPQDEWHERPAAYAVIRDDELRIAVVRFGVEDRERLWLPGGGAQLGETSAETIRREIDEELGREATVGPVLGEAVQFFHATDEDRWYRMTARFHAAELGPRTGTSPEFELEWVNPVSPPRSFFHECHEWATTLVRVD